MSEKKQELFYLLGPAPHFNNIRRNMNFMTLYPNFWSTVRSFEYVI